MSQLQLFLQAEWKELKWWGILLALLGFFLSLKRVKEVRSFSVLFLFLSFMISGPLFFIFSNLPIEAKTTLPILEPYLLMTNLLASFWIALGADWVLNVRFKQALVPILCLGIFYGSNSESRRSEFYAYDYGKNLLKTMPPNSSLYDPDDTTAFTLSYLMTAEKQRKDLVVLMTLRTFWGYEQIKRRAAHVVPEGEFETAQDFIPALLQYQREIKRPLFSDHSSKFPPGWSSFPVGLLSQFGQLGSWNEFEIRQRIFDFYIERSGKKSYAVDQHSDFFTRHLMSRMSASLNNIGILAQNHRHYQKAEEYFRDALIRDPELSQAWNNLGVNYYIQAQYQSAVTEFERAIKRIGGSESLYYHLSLAEKKLGRKS